MTRYPLNAKAVKPRYGTTTIGDVARIRTLPEAPEARTALE